MKILYSKKFKNSFKNIVSRHPKMKDKIEKVISNFEENLYESKYFRKNFFYLNRKITELEF
jgi:mRNA-degrading endonuclease YafQ of YafQ-DinJ toxin-antitoxin module